MIKSDISEKSTLGSGTVHKDD